MRSRQKRTALAIAAGAAVLALVPAADAGTPGPTVSLGKSHGLEYMRAKHANVVSQAGPPANCDGKGQVTGGGGSISGKTANAALNATYPLTAIGTGWQAEGSAGGRARTVTTHAICGGVLVDYASGTSALGTNTVLHASRLCSGADLPIGGGGRATGAGILLIASYPRLPPSTPIGWSPTAYNRTIDDTLFESHAVCSDAHDVRYRQSAPERLRSGSSAKAIARCKSDEAVLGGGFFATRDGAVGYRAYALATKPWDSKQDKRATPDDGWLAQGHNLESLRVDLVAVAVCKR